LKLRKASHTVYKTQYHIVFVTKYRPKILTKGVSQWLRPAFEQLRRYSPDIESTRMGIDRDHVHLHMVIPPKYAVSQVVNRIKVNKGEYEPSDEAEVQLSGEGSTGAPRACGAQDTS
jgi:putative transposase